MCCAQTGDRTCRQPDTDQKPLTQLDDHGFEHVCRRWSSIVQMLYKCFVFAGNPSSASKTTVAI